MWERGNVLCGGGRVCASRSFLSMLVLKIIILGGREISRGNLFWEGGAESFGTNRQIDILLLL